jgi:hypothetical protein
MIRYVLKLKWFNEVALILKKIYCLYSPCLCMYFKICLHQPKFIFLFPTKLNCSGEDGVMGRDDVCRWRECVYEMSTRPNLTQRPQMLTVLVESLKPLFKIEIYRLKGTVSWDFCPQVFYMNQFHPRPWVSYNIKTVSNFFENSRRYWQLKVHHPCSWHQWQMK